MKNIDDKEIGKLIAEASDFSLGEDFTKSVMQKIEKEREHHPEPISQWWWNMLAIGLSFLVLLAYFILNPQLLVHTIQRLQGLVSYLNTGFSPGSLSIIGAVILLFGIDFVAKKRFSHLHSFFLW